MSMIGRKEESYLKKKFWKRGGAILTAFVLLFSSMGVYAAESEETGGEAAVQAEAQGEAAPQESAQSDVQLQADDQYDVNKPVIEEVIFDQNGKEMTWDDTLELRVKAYDSDSGIANVRSTAYFYDEADGYYSGFGFDFSYDEESGYWVGTLDLYDISDTDGYIGEIRVIDQKGNYASWNCMNEQGSQLYTFSVAAQELGEYHAISFDITQNHQTIKAGGELQMSLSVDKIYESMNSSGIYVWFRNEETGEEENFWFYNEDGNTYTTYTTTSTSMSGGKWVLDRIEFDLRINGVPIQLDQINAADYWFNVEELSQAEDQEDPVITSIEMDKNGEIVRPGDQINIRIQAKDNVKLDTENAYLYMHADADIDNSSEYVDLTYNEETETFEGVFTVTEDTYPCEWYISSVTIQDTQYNYASITDFDEDFYSTYPWYVNVVIGDTFVQQTMDLNIYFYALDENGQYKQVSLFQKKEVPKRATFKEAGVEFPEITDGYPGVTQTGWATYEQEKIDENTQILGSYGTFSVYAAYDKTPVTIMGVSVDANGNQVNEKIAESVLFEAGTTYADVLEYVGDQYTPESTYKGLAFQGWSTSQYQNPNDAISATTYVTLYAEYDKGVAFGSYTYLNDKGKWKTSEVTPLLFEKDKGVTYGDLYDEGQKYTPSDLSGEVSLKEWTYIAAYPEDELVTDWDYLSFTADYGDKCVAIGERDYFDAKGYYVFDMEPYIVDKGTPVETIFENLEAMELPQFFEGLKFESWERSGYIDGLTIETSGSYYYVSANYSNCMVRTVIWEPGYGYGSENEENIAYLDCYVAEKGETVEFPETVEGFEDVVWYNYPEGGKVVLEDSFSLTGELNGPVVNPPQPGTDEGTPLPEQQINTIVETVTNAQAGEKIQVDMGEATVVPKEVLEAAKGKNVAVQLNMGDYTWTISGEKINASELKDVNLAVKMDAEVIPTDVIKEIAGDNPTTQLDLAYEGDFGFQAELTLNVGAEHTGKYGNLYYYDSEGKLVFMNAGEIAADGKLSLNFSHASAYVIVFSDEEMSDPTEPGSGASDFTDVHENDWYYDSVQYVSKNKLMTGLNETTFGPIDPLARAQFAVILHRMNGEPEVPYSARFHDVGAGLWYTNAILWAADTQVVTGYSNGNFGPGDLINREQMALMMYRYANYKGYDTSARADFSSYQDASMVSDFAAEAMQWAVGEKIITGKYNETQLDPKGNASRAECATIIMRFVEKYGK